MYEKIGALCAAAAVLAACGGGGGGGFGCDHRAAGLCLEGFQAPSGSQLDWEAVKQACAEDGGVWEPCPQDGRAGTCAVTFSGGGGMAAVFYAGLVCSAGEGEQRCASLAQGLGTGIFTAGGATCGTPTDRTMVCDTSFTPDHACMALSGAMAPERVAVLEGTCAASGGTLVPVCPGGMAATCAYTDAASGLDEVDAYYGGADLAGAASDCAAVGGSWTTY